MLNLILNVKVNDLPPKNKNWRILTKVFYICDPNLVILAKTGLELLRGQASDLSKFWRVPPYKYTMNC